MLLSNLPQLQCRIRYRSWPVTLKKMLHFSLLLPPPTQLAYLIYPDERVYARARGRALLGNVSSYENTTCNFVSYFFYEGSLPAWLRHNFRRILRAE